MLSTMVETEFQPEVQREIFAALQSIAGLDQPDRWPWQKVRMTFPPSQSALVVVCRHGKPEMDVDAYRTTVMLVGATVHIEKPGYPYDVYRLHIGQCPDCGTIHYSFQNIYV